MEGRRSPEYQKPGDMLSSGGSSLICQENVAGLWLLYGYGVSNGSETVENRNFPGDA